MKTRKPYNTQQRDIIIRFLKDNQDKCLTARNIYNGLINDGTRIGEATVYRQLERFISEGIVLKYTDNENTGAFYRYIDSIYECDNHFHLMCVNCGELIHMNCEFIKYLEQHILTDHNFSIDSGRTVLYGLCSGCKTKECSKTASLRQ